jgi:hypothetical protein
MSLTRGKSALVAVLALVVVAGVGRAEAPLRYKFKEGEKLKYVMEQNMDMSMTVAGQNIDMKMLQVMDQTWHVKSVDKDGAAKVLQTFDRIRMKMDGGPINLDYDSKTGKDPEGPIGDVVGPIFKGLVGAEFKFTMDARGQISDVVVPEKIAESIRGTALAAAGLDEFLSQDGMKRMVEQTGLALPEAAPIKGKSWQHKADMKMPFGKMKVDNTYTYEGIETRDGKQLAKISVKPKMEFEPGENAAFTLKLNGQDGEGTIYFDAATGRLEETTLITNMDMVISTGGMDITQKIKQTVTQKLAK